MWTRLTISLTETERVALEALARHEVRGLKDQARYLIVRALSQAPSVDAAAQGAEATHEPA